MDTIWIDTESGTWGHIKTLRVVQVEKEGLSEYMDGMTDSGRSEFGITFGAEVEVTE